MNFKVGSVILAGPEGNVTVIWSEGDRDRRRGLPAGSYRVRTTRIERRKGDDHWFVSSTAPNGTEQRLVAGRTTKLTFAPEVHFQSRVKREGNRLQLGFVIQGADRRGLSVYRNDKRVPVTFEVLSASGKVLARGRMNYG